MDICNSILARVLHMGIGELRNTIHTYKDEELHNLLIIAGWQDAKTKQLIIQRELNNRKNARNAGKYIDRTLHPSIPIRER